MKETRNSLRCARHRRLSPGVNRLIWAMRAYVVMMLAVIGLQIARLM